MSKELRDFRFEASQDPKFLQMHLTDADGNTVTYRLPLARVGRFLHNQFEILEAAGQRILKAGGKPATFGELGQDGLSSSQPTRCRLATKEEGAEEPVFVMDYGVAGIMFQIERQHIAALLAQAMNAWPAPTKPQ